MRAPASFRMFTGKLMECFDRGFQWCVCVSVSRKGQCRTKPLTHNLRGPGAVPVLFATCLEENNTYTHPHHTFCFSLLLSQ